MVVIYVGVMIWLNARLALVVIALLGLFTAHTFGVSPMIKRLHRKLLEDKANHESHLIEILTGIDLVKALAVEPTMFRRWEEAFRRYRSTTCWYPPFLSTRTSIFVTAAQPPDDATASERRHS